MVQQNYREETTYEFQEPTLRWESTVRRENLSGESHGDREEFQPEETEDDEVINKDFGLVQKLGKNLILFQRFHFTIKYRTEKFNCACREKNHILFTE